MFMVNLDKKIIGNIENSDFSEFFSAERGESIGWILENSGIAEEKFMYISKKSEEQKFELMINKEGKCIAVIIKNRFSYDDMISDTVNTASIISEYLIDDMINFYAKKESIDYEQAKNKIENFIGKSIENIDASQAIFILAPDFSSNILKSIDWMKKTGIDIKCIMPEFKKCGDEYYFVDIKYAGEEKTLKSENTADNFEIEEIKKKYEEKIREIEKTRENIQKENESLKENLKKHEEEIEKNKNNLDADFSEEKRILEEEKVKIEEEKLKIQMEKQNLEEEKVNLEIEKGKIEEEKVKLNEEDNSKINTENEEMQELLKMEKEEIEENRKKVEEEKMILEEEKKNLESNKNQIEEEKKVITEEKNKLETEKQNIEVLKKEIEEQMKNIEEEKLKLEEEKNKTQEEEEITESENNEENIASDENLENEEDKKESSIVKKIYNKINYKDIYQGKQEKSYQVGEPKNYEVERELRRVFARREDNIRMLKKFLEILLTKNQEFERGEMIEQFYHAGIGANMGEASKNLNKVTAFILDENNKMFEEIVSLEILNYHGEEIGNNFKIEEKYRDSVKKVIKEMQ